jgi:polar amino acid transport system ATP-binding protein
LTDTSGTNGASSSGEGAFVEIRGVSKWFGELQVLDDIDLSVRKHEVVCLIGASGSGKSTLLRCLNMLERIEKGDIVVDGQSLTTGNVNVNALRRKIGIVFQAYNLFPHMTVLQNVMLGPRKVRGLSRDQCESIAHELLHKIGLEAKAQEYPDRLSGGQQQRVAIARALAMEPELMLLDEITSALDPQLVSEVLQLVRGLTEVGMTMIIATHEMGFAREVASKVCFLDGGRILEEGPPEQIFTSPTEARTRSFLARVLDAEKMA